MDSNRDSTTKALSTASLSIPSEEEEAEPGSYFTLEWLRKLKNNNDNNAPPGLSQDQQN